MKKFTYDKTNEYLGKAFLLLALWTPAMVWFMVTKESIDGIWAIILVWFTYMIIKME